MQTCPYQFALFEGFFFIDVSILHCIQTAILMHARSGNTACVKILLDTPKNSNRINTFLTNHMHHDSLDLAKV